MEIIINTPKNFPQTNITVAPGFYKKDKDGKGGKLINNHWPKAIKEFFENLSHKESFNGKKGEYLNFSSPDGNAVLVVGLGEKNKIKAEDLRKEMAKLYKALAKKYASVGLCLDSFNVLGGVDKSAAIMSEAFYMADYQYSEFLSEKPKVTLKKIHLITKETAKKAKIAKAVEATKLTVESINVARDFVNEPPNSLNSETFAKKVEADAKKALKGKGVKVKVLGKTELKKEKMGLFLSVNAGSAFGPRLVHLTYTPKNANKKTKHIALVGKGLTFDTGGLSIKPAANIINMKFDMAGAATVYGAFRAAVLAGSKNKITCILGMTDNAVSRDATLPDSVCKARNGKTVEILNTDAEGRLVLADCLDYACDLKPDSIINAATLTGAIVLSLGTEVCGVFSNKDKFAKELLSHTKANDESAWHMPIMDVYRNDMKGSISDLKNIGSRPAGAGKAAAFLENFIKDDIDWAHLDIAGIGDSQGYLPYCPSKGASGLMIRSLKSYLTK